MVKFRFLVLLFTALCCIGAGAKKFSNSYIEFDMPDNWLCRAEGGQHICQPASPTQSKEAIVVMAAKYKGPDDTMEKYKGRLNEIREVKDIKGTKYKSSVKYTKYNPISGTVWLDSMHESSEVPGFVTRYLATVQKGAGILVTFSAHKSVIDNYTPNFLQMVNSIRVSDNIPAPSQELSPDMMKLGGQIAVGDLGDVEGGKKKLDPSERKPIGEITAEQTSNWLLYALIAVAILVIIIILRRKKGRTNKRR